MKKHSKKGFTLSELMVVLAIMAVVAAIAIPFAIHYIRLAEFRKNESNAKTVYLAAESELTWYRTSGQWEQFRKSVIKKGILNETFGEENEKLKGRKIYAITLDNCKSSVAAPSSSGTLVEDILEDNAYDKDFFNAAITIEIDVDTGQVYSAFYATRCGSLAYDGTDEDDANGSRILSISAADDNRAYENRRGRFLGYYSVEDVTNVVDMKPVRLKVGSINLVNSETLSLNWSSTSRHDNLDVEFTITFYKDKETAAEEEKALFSLTVNRADLRSEGWTGTDGQMAVLELKKASETEAEDGTGSPSAPEQPTQKWAFPLTYQEMGNGQNARFSLVLDGMMSPELMESLEANQTSESYVKNNSTTITRLESVVPELADPQDIYAVVEVKPTYKNMSGDTREYRASSPVKSNVENTMFAKGTEKTDNKLEAKITRFRHLSNIRYYDEGKTAEFTLTGRNMDWTSNSTGLYDLAEEKKQESNLMTVQWKSVKDSDSEDEILEFPSIALLAENHTLKGKSDHTLLSNLRLGAGSMPDDEDVDKIYKNKEHQNAYSEYMGLFCESEGTIQDLTLQNPKLTLAGNEESPVSDYTHLQGAGILCGRSEGTIRNISVRSTDTTQDLVVVRMADNRAENQTKAKQAGIGGLVGVLAAKDESGILRPMQSGKMEEVTMEGSVLGKLPKPGSALEENRNLQAPQVQAEQYSYGIGGIFGYAWIGADVEVVDCQNRASVTGNLFTGGIGGNMRGNYHADSAQNTADIRDCYNDGLVLCAQKYGHEDAECELEGRYFGGILGFGKETQITTSSSASGRSVGYEYTYTEDVQTSPLVGQYVGGIIGYGNSCRLSGCSTQKDGYILGSDYVGGIAGGLTNNLQDVIVGAEGISVTTNAGYVIGKRYVGGIVGKNDGNIGIDSTVITSTIKDCVNNGVAAGYDCYIGGIAGYNGQNGEIRNCASYYSDYGQTMLNTILNKWQATTADCVGGLAGYNNGTIRFGEGANTTVKSVSSVVVGNNFVGGMVGFNDAQGQFCGNQETEKIGYSLIGGQVYAVGDGVGGCIGLNASAKVLAQEIEVRPSSVNGTYCVGGFIGANVVDLSAAGTNVAGKDVEMSKISVNNVLGNVTGTAFTGGVVGYQRTYTSAQLQGEQTPDGETLLLARLLRTASNPVESGALLPKLGVGNLPTAVVASQDTTRLIISNADNHSSSNLNSANTNIPVIADLYAGGIVGYCERNSKLVLRDCRNDGNITQKTPAGSEADVSAKVSLKAYLVYLSENGGGGNFLTAAEEIAKAEQENGNQSIYVSMVGGVIGSNLENQVIDHCANKGSMNGFVGLGGIVGLNAGGIFDCELQDNFGNTGLDYIGGIAGLNVKADDIPRTYQGGNYEPGTYTSGTIAACTTAANRTVFGRSYVGGIAGYNMTGGVLTKNQNQINITAIGSYAGGITGANSGIVEVSEDTSISERTVSGNQGTGIGGIVGWNQQGGTVSVAALAADGNASAGTGDGASVGNSGVNKDEVIAVGTKVTVIGSQKVGGIAGINEGQLSASDDYYLTSQAKSVRALEGYAGGIAGESGKMSGQTSGNPGTSESETGEGGTGSTDADEDAAGGSQDTSRANPGSIEKARNKSTEVTADKGPAGGIVAVNQKNVTLKQCQNLGNVNSDHGYAGGIAAENYGMIQECIVGDTTQAAAATSGNIVIRSRDTQEIGAICAVNRKAATIQSSVPLYRVELSGTATVVGGIAGTNQGIIEEVDHAEIRDKIKQTSTKKEENRQPDDVKSTLNISVSSNALAVGGAAGHNESDAVIREVKLHGFYFIDFKNYQYLGGITGVNQSEALVENCTYSEGEIKQETGSAVGNCYGGIAGLNQGTLQGCGIEGIQLDIQGVYTATSTSTAAQKEEWSSHVGGIAGKNEEDSTITECLVDNSGRVTNEIRVGNGMAGGIVGYNKGTVELSGDKDTTDEICGDSSIYDLIGHGFTEDAYYVAWGSGELEDFQYVQSKNQVSEDRSLSLIMRTNGNVGGITAYNAPTGSVSYCATGDWYLNNKSEAIGVGTGGIIGMNESERNLSFLLNRAFVGREIRKGDTNRFAGGIIGNQNNTTTDEWRIENCVNYGTVYCLNTHYSGGIMGQWTGTGGNIEKCYNYGNLQTTYGTGWLGASGGIVAQLYHAYEGNEYNIISCRNFGNIYGRTGSSLGDNNTCANDSAGILGNVTAYRTSGNGAQDLMIQVVDCVNESGVEIYSNSMASGIVGFFSCDNPDAGSIAQSTGNIKLNIERCRNFASRLQGRQYVGGILGDRYGETGSQNTILQDCYSVNLDSQSYNFSNFPIISYKSGSSREGAIQAKRNYFFDWESSYKWTDINISDNLKRAGANRAYYYNNGNQWYALYIDPAKNTIKSSDIDIKNDGIVYQKGTTEKVGRVLFEIKEDFPTIAQIVQKDRNFDQYVRTAYYKVEGSTPGGVMPAPESVQLSRLVEPADKAFIEVTPAKDTVNMTEYTKPFKYAAKLYADNGGSRTLIKEFEFYTNSYSVDLSKYPEAQAGSLFVEVRACSMFDNVQDSASVSSTDTAQGQKRLPNPDIRIELVKENGYKYHFSLEEGNKKKYEQLNLSNEDYSITISFADGTEVELKPENNLEASIEPAGADLQQLLAQAKPSSTNKTYAPSSQVSVPVYLPKYKPLIQLGESNGTGTAVPSVSYTGTSLADLTVTVTLDASGSGSITTPPIYRADLLGTWIEGEKSGEEIVLASTDILTASNGSASATFSNLSDGMEKVKDLKVQVWYAQSGLGPVYTWHSLDSADGGNICTLKEMETQSVDGVETKVPVWEYSYSTVLDENDKEFEKYRWESAKLFDWIGPPILEDVNSQLTPVNQNPLQYKFSWGHEPGQDSGHNHIVTLKGITKDTDGKENQVSIITNEEVTGNEYTVSAENWNYSEVELTVACKGDAAKNQIGLSSSGRYLVKQRLPKPEQPIVTNQDVNELIYTFEWPPIHPETGCDSYEIYAEKYVEDTGTWEKVAPGPGLPAGAITSVEAGKDENKKNGKYSIEHNLEPYTDGNETKLRVYLVAKADPNDTQYTDSLDGAAYELTIPARIAPPDVTWTSGWTYDRNTPISTGEFEAKDPLQTGKLNVTITPQAGGTQTGDSSYLLKAYVFDSQSNAQQAKTLIESGQTGGLPGLLTTYPAEDTNGNISPIVMDVNAGNTYSHTLRGLSAQYAGKWVLFYTRISSGNGQLSSKWVANPDVWRLPYVRLSAPDVNVSNPEREIEVKNLLNPDVPELETWKASQTVLNWNQVELSDTYEMTLTGEDPSLIQTYRIEESETGGTDGTVQKAITVYHKTLSEDGQTVVWNQVKQVEPEVSEPTPGEGNDKNQKTFIFELPGYQASVNSSYIKDSLSIPYQAELKTMLEVKWEEGTGFSYTLILPDADSLKTAEGILITEEPGLRMTSKTDIWAEVKTNSREGEVPVSQSDAYVKSEPTTTSFTNQ